MIKGTRRRVSALLGALLIAALNVAPAAATNGTVWTTLPGLPTARADLSAVTAPCPAGQTGNCVYALGGTPNLATTRWQLAAATDNCPPGETGMCVYAIGGFTAAGAAVGTVEAFDPPSPGHGG